MHCKAQTTRRVQTNPRKSFGIAFILASALFAGAAEPPPDLARRVAEREGVSEAERSRYTYKQWLTVEEFDRRGNKGGIYQERREIVFLENNERVERMIQKPISTLKLIQMTEEDFRDMRDIQPLLFTKERLSFYETKPKGEEKGRWYRLLGPTGPA